MCLGRVFDWHCPRHQLPGATVLPPSPSALRVPWTCVRLARSSPSIARGYSPPLPFWAAITRHLLVVQPGQLFELAKTSLVWRGRMEGSPARDDDCRVT